MGDYEDFLRHRGLRQWDKDSPEALAVRRRYKSDRSDQSDRSDRSDCYHLRTATAEEAANTLLCLINQASYLLHRQLDRLEQDFLNHGGFTERLYSVRSRYREEASAAPTCPRCGKPMCLRTAHKGPNAGKRFWGCSAYPECNGTRAADNQP